MVVSRECADTLAQLAIKLFRPRHVHAERLSSNLTALLKIYSITIARGLDMETDIKEAIKFWSVSR